MLTICNVSLLRDHLFWRLHWTAKYVLAREDSQAEKHPHRRLQLLFQ